MAGISYTIGLAGILNPTEDFLPVRHQNEFVDSMIGQNDGGNELFVENADKLTINGTVVVATAGAASGDYLEVWCNGTQYKIELLTA